jgi:hypothetical protein
MFYFVVRHLRWVARLPGFPQLFDALLVAQTCLFRRSRLAAMESLEREALQFPGVYLKVHRLGGIEFVEKSGRELGHLHGNGLLDMIVGKENAAQLLARNSVQSHHIFPKSKWVSFQLYAIDDLPMAIQLIHLAYTRVTSAKETQGLPTVEHSNSSFLHPWPRS